jgi:hypothetical protein
MTRKTGRSRAAWVLASWGIGLAAWTARPAAAAEPAEPAPPAPPAAPAEPVKTAAPDLPPGTKLVPLAIKLPKALFEGTPKNIKPAPTLEKYDERPRPPFLVPEGCTNLALGKKVTSSDPEPIIGELRQITDGDKEGSDGCYVEFAPGKQWVQVDLGAPAVLYAVLFWHYHAQGRVYHDIVVQTADDADFIENVQTLYNNDFDNSSGLGIGKDLEFIEDCRGRLIDARGVKARYIRFYSRGNSSNDLNHFIEIEAYGKPAS